MTDHPLGIGVIGCGRAAEELHLPAMTRNPGVRSVAIADVDVHARERLARRFEIARQYADADALLADRDVALVDICTPPAAHPDAALAAIAAGKHVLVEKPLALDVEVAERLAEAERAATVVTALGLNLRCHRLVESARAIVATGTLGPIATLRTTWTVGYERGRPDHQRAARQPVRSCEPGDRRRGLRLQQPRPGRSALLRVQQHGRRAECDPCLRRVRRAVHRCGGGSRALRRWRHRGGRLVFRREAVIYHAHDLRLGSFVRQHRAYGRGAYTYHRVRAARGSGRMRDDLRFHAELLARLLASARRVPAGTAARGAALAVVWQAFNAAGWAEAAATDATQRVSQRLPRRGAGGSTLGPPPA